MNKNRDLKVEWHFQSHSSLKVKNAFRVHIFKWMEYWLEWQSEDLVIALNLSLITFVTLGLRQNYLYCNSDFHINFSINLLLSL